LQNEALDRQTEVDDLGCKGSMSIRTDVRSIESSAEMGATVKPRWGSEATMRSEVRRGKASRTAPTLTWKRSAILSMRSFALGACTPSRSSCFNVS
jgi:hypothetical protein